MKLLGMGSVYWRPVKRFKDISRLSLISLSENQRTCDTYFSYGFPKFVHLWLYHTKRFDACEV